MGHLQHNLDALRQSHPDLVPDDTNAEQPVNVCAEVETSGPVVAVTSLGGGLTSSLRNLCMHFDIPRPQVSWGKTNFWLWKKYVECCIWFEKECSW